MMGPKTNTTETTMLKSGEAQDTYGTHSRPERLQSYGRSLLLSGAQSRSGIRLDSGDRPLFDPQTGSMMYRASRFRRSKGSSLSDRRSRSYRSTDVSKFEAPPCDTRLRYKNLNFRQPRDAKYRKSYDILDIEKLKYVSREPHFDIREPSFTNFKVPFQMICKERYNKTSKKYEAQLSQEIQNLIDNQPSAQEATYFVRIVSFTTLWPPYHTVRELTDTSHNFYRLTPEENTRFQNIMTNDFSYI